MYFLYANPEKAETISAARRLADRLLSVGEAMYLDAWLHELLRVGQSADLDHLPKGLRAILSLGGDGTLLRTLPAAAMADVPVLGINMGHVGFLLETDLPGIILLLDRLRQGDYQIERRSMLRASILGHNASHLVMNEISVYRGANPSSISVDVFADEELVYSSHGDGMIVSTATGSTGYCLSAGGPVLHPSLGNIVVLPICTHKAQQLPLVLAQNTVVRLKAKASPGRTQQVALDGQSIFEVRETTEVEIRTANEHVSFIRFEPQHFFTRLRLKQAEWSGK